MKPVAWKNYRREGVKPFTAGEIRTILAVLTARAHQGERGSIQCEQAISYIRTLQDKATECAKRAHLEHERAESMVVVVDELRRQNAEMRKLIAMQSVRLRQRVGQ